MWRRFAITARAVFLGWATLWVLVFIARLLLIWMGRALGASWVPTVRLGLDCSVLAASGWVIGRFGPAKWIVAVIVFVAVLAVPSLGEMAEVRILWIFQLTGDAFQDRHYWDSLLDTAVSQAFLLGSLFVGARLSRRSAVAPPSIVRPTIVPPTIVPPT